MNAPAQLSFPIAGIVGIVTGGPGEPETAAEALAASSPAGLAVRPDGVEVRADLFSPPREAMAWVRRLSAMAPVIFTARLRAHGGEWDGDEAARTALYREALAAGAALVDAEWDSPAAQVLAREHAPLVASHHDFAGMPNASELDRITTGMLALAPKAIKCVPTAASPADGLRMLQWTSQARAGEPARLGFAMGEMGLASRVLSIAWGAPFTYGSLARSVAPGQVSVRELQDLYRAKHLSRATRVFGVAGNPVAHSLSPYLHNAGFHRHGLNAVYLPYLANRLSELLDAAENLRLEGLSVTLPFKEQALAAAHEADERSRASGAANTLVLKPSQDGLRGLRISAFNTDFDGVLEPLRRRGVHLKGLPAAILGNGGAARGAARALAEAGAQVTLYFRNPERGVPVAAALGVRGAELASFRRGCERLIINATPLGLHSGDVSPLAAEAFEPASIAFDMIYDPAQTPFLMAATSAGATTIPGREMLVSQAWVQFRLFTGLDASHDELEAAFLAGQEARTAARSG